MPNSGDHMLFFGSSVDVGHQFIRKALPTAEQTWESCVGVKDKLMEEGIGQSGHTGQVLLRLYPVDFLHDLESHLFSLEPELTAQLFQLRLGCCNPFSSFLRLHNCSDKLVCCFRMRCLLLANPLALAVQSLQDIKRCWRSGGSSAGNKNQ